MRPANGIDMTGHGSKKEASGGTGSCRRKPRYTPSSPSVSLTIRQGRLRPGQRQTWADHARDQRCPPRLSATQAPIPPSGGRPRKKRQNTKRCITSRQIPDFSPTRKPTPTPRRSTQAPSPIETAAAAGQYQGRRNLPMHGTCSTQQTLSIRSRTQLPRTVAREASQNRRVSRIAVCVRAKRSGAEVAHPLFRPEGGLGRSTRTAAGQRG
jgi:hypothetical protein